MAHHSRTPQSVLDAPVSRPLVISAQHGFSRTERRRGPSIVPGMTDGLRKALLRAAAAAGVNVPHVRTEPRIVELRRIRRAVKSATHRVGVSR